MPRKAIMYRPKRREYRPEWASYNDPDLFKAIAAALLAGTYIAGYAVWQILHV